VSTADDVLFGGPGRPGPAVVDVTDRALAQARATTRPIVERVVERGERAVERVLPAQAGELVLGPPDPDDRADEADPSLLVELGPDGAPVRWRPPEVRHRALLGALLAADAAGLAAGWAASVLAPDPRWHAVSGRAAALAVLVVAVPAWWGAVALAGGYPARHRVTRAPRVGRLVDGAVRFAAPALVIAALARPQLAHGLALALPVAVVAACLLRTLVVPAVRFAVGETGRRVLVVGSAVATSAVLDRLAAAGDARLHVVGRCAWERLDAADAAASVDGYGVGEADVVRRRVTAAARRARADLVLVADASALPADGLRRLAWSLEGTGLGLLVATGLRDVAASRMRVHLAADLPLVAVDEPAFTGAPRVVKELIDRAGAALLLTLFAPLMLLVALAVRLSDGGPAVFRQERVGLHGQRFTMYKFRSMRADAEGWRARLEPLNEHRGRTLFKLRRDPRVTTVGRILRRSSLDELPQLLNVLRGEMSLVGPRPPLPAEVECYETEALRRLRVKPGLTGLWQVSGRADLDWREAVRLDLSYVENWSVGLDVRILCRTFLAVTSGQGAR
jgi:exopolysaccharide biosynthesis polyprenyl glycosylphosphotransferase